MFIHCSYYLQNMIQRYIEIHHLRDSDQWQQTQETWWGECTKEIQYILLCVSKWYDSITWLLERDCYFHTFKPFHQINVTFVFVDTAILRPQLILVNKSHLHNHSRVSRSYQILVIVGQIARTIKTKDRAIVTCVPFEKWKQFIFSSFDFFTLDHNAKLFCEQTHNRRLRCDFSGNYEYTEIDVGVSIT